MTDTSESSNSTTRRRILQSTATGVAGTAIFANGAAAHPRSLRRRPRNEVVVENGRSQPTFRNSTAVREDVWVETTTDTDGSGSPDRVHVEVAYPSDAGPSNQLPVVLEPSPYYGGLNSGSSHSMDDELYVPDETIDRRARGGTEDAIITSEDDLVEFTGSEGDPIGPSAYEEEFRPRGFAWAYAASIGTEQSTGCPTIGGSKEIEAMKAVVDWFNGRATAYTSRSGGSTVEADWTNGATGMLGVSYNGTLPNGVAATGVDGLETIVPIAAISSWYTYYRANGAVIATGAGAGAAMDTDSLFDSVLTRSGSYVCDSVRQELIDGQDRVTGNKNDFWDDRDYVLDVDQVEASVLVVHGLHDTNVKTRNAGRWYDALTEGQVDTEHRMWLMQAAHADPINQHPNRWLDALNVWLTHWLQEPGDAIDDVPIATVERPDGSFDEYDAWPHQDVERVNVSAVYGGDGPGGLSTQAMIGDMREETFADNPSTPTTSLVDELDSEYSLVYRTNQLQTDLHVSGTIEPNLAISCNEPAALLTAILVEYDQYDNASIVCRGWMNANNFESLYQSYQLGSETGLYRARFPMQMDDYIFDSGNRLGIVLRSSDYDFTKRPSHYPELSVVPGWSSFDIPVVGGIQAFRNANGA
ncbi:CocE/NonD family hydrolase [Halovivax limisalsi]|uniref:CocE/NonD family hydrolase n=1 Tax=Halovivax limisalsi TaxID=1453760 RepID=UPI001FFC42E8|nr:CocE/NonD family hydrolase [Halovivax limisalsi]